MTKAPWEVAKAAGNESYQAGRFEDAIAQWSTALDLVSDNMPSSSNTTPLPMNTLSACACSDDSDVAVCATRNLRFHAFAYAKTPFSPTFLALVSC